MFRNARFWRTRFDRGVTLRASAFEGTADFGAAQFGDLADLSDADFANAHFGGARFGSGTYARKSRFVEVDFGGAHFGSDADFGEAAFGPGLRFGGVEFGPKAYFHRARFGPRAHIGGARFGQGAFFDGASFESGVDFDGAWFAENASLQGVVFAGDASFRGTRFGEAADLAGTRFGQVWFDGARFGPGVRLGPISCDTLITLSGTVLDEDATMDVEAPIVAGERLRLNRGARITVRGAEVSFEEAEFASSCLVVGAGPHRSRLISLERANVGGLTIADVDVRACRFRRVNDLDLMRFGSGTAFEPVPPGMRAPREAIAEEHSWRRSNVTTNAAWMPASTSSDNFAPSADIPLEANEIAAIYRALRKGREDAKDYSGANDLYYGEMELRRLEPSPSRQEPFGKRLGARSRRVLLEIYRWLGGYGVRPVRPGVAIVALVLAAAPIFAFAALAPPSPSPTLPVTPAMRGPAGAAKRLPSRRATCRPRGASTLSCSTSVTAPFLTGLVVTMKAGLLLPISHKLRLGGEYLQVLLRLVMPILLAFLGLGLRAQLRR
jgi:uncharacterized protein YjbI with pentapeptide repeats